MANSHSFRTISAGESCPYVYLLFSGQWWIFPGAIPVMQLGQSDTRGFGRTDAVRSSMSSSAPETVSSMDLVWWHWNHRSRGHQIQRAFDRLLSSPERVLRSRCAAGQVWSKAHILANGTLGWQLTISSACLNSPIWLVISVLCDQNHPGPWGLPLLLEKEELLYYMCYSHLLVAGTKNAHQLP